LLTKIYQTDLASPIDLMRIAVCWRPLQILRSP